MSGLAEPVCASTPMPGESTPTPRQTTPLRTINDIREYCWLYTLDQALFALLEPDQADDYKAEADLAAAGRGATMGAQSAEISRAVDVGWQAALNEANNVLEHLRRRVWPMAAARMPERTIIAAADEVLFSHRTFLPDDMLMPLLKRIWTAATPRRKGGRRGRKAA